MRSSARATKHDQASRRRRTWSAKSSTSPDSHNHWLRDRPKDDRVPDYLMPVIDDGGPATFCDDLSRSNRSCGMETSGAGGCEGAAACGTDCVPALLSAAARLAPVSIG